MANMNNDNNNGHSQSPRRDQRCSGDDRHCWLPSLVAIVVCCCFFSSLIAVVGCHHHGTISFCLLPCNLGNDQVQLFIPACLLDYQLHHRVRHKIFGTWSHLHAVLIDKAEDPLHDAQYTHVRVSGNWNWLTQAAKSQTLKLWGSSLISNKQIVV